MRITDKTVRIQEEFSAVEMRIDFEGAELGHAMNMAFSALAIISKLVLDKHPENCNCLASEFAKICLYHTQQVDQEMKTIIVQRKLDKDNDTTK